MRLRDSLIFAVNSPVIRNGGHYYNDSNVIYNYNYTNNSDNNSLLSISFNGRYRPIETTDAR